MEILYLSFLIFHCISQTAKHRFNDFNYKHSTPFFFLQMVFFSPLQWELIFKQLLIALLKLPTFWRHALSCQNHIWVKKTSIVFESLWKDLLLPLTSLFASCLLSAWPRMPLYFKDYSCFEGRISPETRWSQISSLCPFGSHSIWHPLLDAISNTIFANSYQIKSLHQTKSWIIKQAIYKSCFVININQCCTIQTHTHTHMPRHTLFLMSSIRFGITVCWQTLYYCVKWWAAFSTEISRTEGRTGGARISFHIHYIAKWCTGYIYGLISAP